MRISHQTWLNYIKKLDAIDSKAADMMQEWVEANGLEDRQALVEYAYALTTKYGEAAAALACEMYDATALASGVTLPAAVPAETPTIEEVGRAVNGSLRHSQVQVPSTVYRLTKQSAADTTLQNAARDGAQFAWIPYGDTCPFCITLASRGWQYMSKKALKGGHAEHIHANCDCQYGVRFSEKDSVAGYNPKVYEDMYYGTEGSTPQERINSMRRVQYQQNRDHINEMKRAAYARRQTGGRITGGHHYSNEVTEDRRSLAAAKQYENYSRVDDSEIIANNTGFSVKDIQTIRSHVFFEKHNLDVGYQRFAPDYDMAVAWRRLQNGNFLPRDITLLNHELLESQLEKMYNLSAREAHERTQETYNWVDQLMRETNGKGEEDDLL